MRTIFDSAFKTPRKRLREGRESSPGTKYRFVGLDEQSLSHLLRTYNKLLRCMFLHTSSNNFPQITNGISPFFDRNRQLKSAISTKQVRASGHRATAAQYPIAISHSRQCTHHDHSTCPSDRERVMELLLSQEHVIAVLYHGAYPGPVKSPTSLKLPPVSNQDRLTMVT